MKGILCLAFFIIFSIPASAQGNVQLVPSVEEVYLARDDGNGKAGEQVTEFRIGDIPIYCIVLLDSQVKVTVKMNFVAVNVAGVRPETKVVTASYTTKEGQNRVNFTGRPEGNWTPGKYRVDLFIDGRIAKNIEFEIKAVAGLGGNTSAAKYLPEPVPSRPKAVRRVRQPMK